MTGENIFKLEALKCLNEKNDLINQIISDAGVSRKECFSNFFSAAKTNKTLGKLEFLGIAIVGYEMAVVALKRERYDSFFIGLNVMITFMAAKEINDVKKILSEFSKANALKRHAETYAMKEDAIEYWQENIDPKLSNDKAALILAKVFPLSHRKLSEYISEAKKQSIHHTSKV